MKPYLLRAFDDVVDVLAELVGRLAPSSSPESRRRRGMKPLLFADGGRLPHHIPSLPERRAQGTNGPRPAGSARAEHACSSSPIRTTRAGPRYSLDRAEQNRETSLPTDNDVMVSDLHESQFRANQVRILDAAIAEFGTAGTRGEPALHRLRRPYRPPAYLQTA